MTTEELEQLMKAHKCSFILSSNDDGYECEMYDATIMEGLLKGIGTGPSIVEAVYEALKSKCGDKEWTDDQKLALSKCLDSLKPGVEWWDSMGNPMKP